MISTETLNHVAAQWAAFMRGGLIDATAVLAVVGAIWLIFRRRMSAHAAYALFLLVPLKLLLPIPIPVPGWAEPIAPRAHVERIASWDAGPPLPPRADFHSVETIPSTPETVSVPDAQTHAYVAPALSTSGMADAGVGRGRNGAAGEAGVRADPDDPRAERLASRELPVDMGRLRAMMGVRREVPVVESAAVGSPAVWGLFRPRIVVPPGLAEGLAPDT